VKKYIGIFIVILCFLSYLAGIFVMKWRVEKAHEKTRIMKEKAIRSEFRPPEGLVIGPCNPSATVYEKSAGEIEAEKYKVKADMRIYFINWDNVYIQPPPLPCSEQYPCTPEVDAIYRKAKKIENLEKETASFTGNKELAVVIISHNFYDYFSEAEKDFEIEKIENIFTKNGFHKTVFLAETPMGDILEKTDE